MGRKSQVFANSSSGNSSVRKGGVQSMAELMKKFSSQVASLKRGDSVTGVITKLTPKEILMDIGYKGEALVLEFDKKNLENLMSLLKIGDRVSAQVLSPESEEGFPVVSLRRTLDELIFSGLEEKFQKGEVIAVQVTEATRGGFFAETPNGVRGFLPLSQVLTQDSNILGKTLEIKIIELDKTKKRVVFSQKSTFYEIDPAILKKNIQKESIVSAVVTQVSPYGVFVSIEPKRGVLIEGFIHISEVSYQRIEDLVHLFKPGEKIRAQVLAIDQELRRVNLSIKKLEVDKFEEIKLKYKKEEKVEGRVTDVKMRGVTIEIEPGIFGFIQSSKIPQGTPYKIGEKLKAEVVEFDERRHIIVLTPVLKAKPIGYR